MRSYIYSIMCDKREGPVAWVVKGLLSIISVFYLPLVLLHRYLYGKGILKSHKVDCTVISVGNITLGGTGKTPFVSRLVGLLKEKGYRPAVLIRGYGVDEWKMLKGLLQDVPVVVGRDRVKNARLALKEYSPDFIVLDDGFQHKRLFRDVNIALIDATNPFGNGKLFPRGILREPIEALKKADFIMLSKTDKGRGNIRGIYNRLKAIKSERDILESYHRPLYLVDVKENRKMELSSVKGKCVCMLSSIADSSYFRYTVEGLGANVVSEFAFPDHYEYKEKDIKNIVDKCRGCNAEYIITTEKDLPKLIHQQSVIRNPQSAICNPLLALHIELEITKGKESLLERCL